MAPNRLAIRHVMARPLRSALTVGAIALSARLLGFLLLLTNALEQDWSPYMGQRAIVMAKTSFFEKLPMAYLPKLEETPGVLYVTPFDFLMAFWHDNRPENQVPVSATDVESFL